MKDLTSSPLLAYAGYGRRASTRLFTTVNFITDLKCQLFTTVNFSRTKTGCVTELTISSLTSIKGSVILVTPAIVAIIRAQQSRHI